MQSEGPQPADRTEAVLAALCEVIQSISQSGFNLDEVLQTIIRHAVDLSRAEFGNQIA